MVKRILYYLAIALGILAALLALWLGLVAIWAQGLKDFLDKI